MLTQSATLFHLFVVLQEREASLASALAEAQASMASLQKLHTASQNQLFALQSQSEEVVASRQVRSGFASF
jgi:F0F1-type ATP synthase membrane subunit b/b'